MASKAGGLSNFEVLPSKSFTWCDSSVVWLVSDRNTVYVGNLSYEATEEDLADFFENCGPIERITICSDLKVNLIRAHTKKMFFLARRISIGKLKKSTFLTTSSLPGFWSNQWESRKYIKKSLVSQRVWKKSLVP